MSEVLAETTDRPNGIFTDTDVLHVADVLDNIVEVGDGAMEVSLFSFLFFS